MRKIRPGAAIGAITVQVHFGAFQLDNGQRMNRLALADLTEHGIGSFAGEFVVLNLIPAFGILGESGVSQSLTKIWLNANC